jgi:hypothetical protein
LVGFYKQGSKGVNNFMPILPEAIIAAFNALGGERNIKEIKDWVYEKYGDRWKDLGTSLEDVHKKYNNQ